MSTSMFAQVLGWVATAQDAAATAPAKESSRTALSYIRDGGPMGVILISLSVVALTLMIIIVLRNRREAWTPPATVEALSRHLRDGDVEGARRVCAAPEHQSFITAVVGGALARCGRSAFGFLELRSALEDAGAAEVDRRYRTVETIALIAALGPMLGLLGTVFGLIGAFGSIGELEGAARSKELAGFMALALVNTAEGLAVAIPCTAFYSIFRRRIDRLALEAGVLIEHIALPLERLGSDKPAGPRPVPARAAGAAPVARPAVGGAPAT